MPRGTTTIAILGLAGGAVLLLLNLTSIPTRQPAVPLPMEPAPLRTFDVIAEYPHDPEALTQGLIYSGGFLYESTGRQGHASLRKVELTTGRVVQQRALDDAFLGEGLTEWSGQLIQFTPMQARPNLLRSLTDEDFKFSVASLGRFFGGGDGVRYDVHSLEPQATFTYRLNGWGLTHDDRALIMSDGTSMLRFLNPDTMKWREQVEVVDSGKGIRWLNELEFVNGEVYANIWQDNRIAIIRPESGQVTAWIDLSELVHRMNPPPKDVDGLDAYGKSVANGIAYDSQTGRLFVTGKNWPRLFEIRLREIGGQATQFPNSKDEFGN